MMALWFAWAVAGEVAGGDSLGGWTIGKPAPADEKLIHDATDGGSPYVVKNIAGVEWVLAPTMCGNLVNSVSIRMSWTSAYQMAGVSPSFRVVGNPAEAVTAAAADLNAALAAAGWSTVGGGTPGTRAYDWTHTRGSFVRVSHAECSTWAAEAPALAESMGSIANQDVCYVQLTAASGSRTCTSGL